jgi:hypothetical protein
MMAMKIETVMMTMKEFIAHFTYTGSGDVIAAKAEWYKLCEGNDATKDVDCDNMFRIGISMERKRRMTSMAEIAEPVGAAAASSASSELAVPLQETEAEARARLNAAFAEAEAAEALTRAPITPTNDQFRLSDEPNEVDFDGSESGDATSEEGFPIDAFVPGSAAYAAAAAWAERGFAELVDTESQRPRRSSRR